MNWQEQLTILAASGAGLNAGIYFAFSAFTMQALGRLPARDGLVAMQLINEEAPRPPLLAAMLGTVAAGVPLVMDAASNLAAAGAPLRLVGAALAIASAVITITFHVPRNDRLAAVDPDTASAPAQWSRYQRSWTRGNHVRATVALAGATALAASLAG